MDDTSVVVVGVPVEVEHEGGAGTDIEEGERPDLVGEAGEGWQEEGAAPDLVGLRGTRRDGAFQVGPVRHDGLHEGPTGVVVARIRGDRGVPLRQREIGVFQQEVVDRREEEHRGPLLGHRTGEQHRQHVVTIQDVARDPGVEGRLSLHRPGPLPERASDLIELLGHRGPHPARGRAELSPSEGSRGGAERWS